MDLGLAGKRAWVVGASGDIGRAIAVALAREGCHLALTGRDGDTLAATARAAAHDGGKIVTLVHDMADPDPARWNALAAELASGLGPVDVLVYAAAAKDHPARLPSIPAAHWDGVLATDLTGCWRASSLVLPGMAKRQWGRVIAIGSLMGDQGGFAEGAYAAAKAGLIGLMRTTALEYGRFGVTANVVVPGRIMTSRTAAAGERVAEAMRRIVPLEREGRPEEVADVVAFLASGQASYITGAAIPVTGGRELGKLPM